MIEPFEPRPEEPKRRLLLSGSKAIDAVLDYTGLTERQAKVLQYIAYHIIKNMAPPTYNQMSEHFGITRYGCVKHVMTLERKGKVIYFGGSFKLVGVQVRLEKKQPNPTDPDNLYGGTDDY